MGTLDSRIAAVGKKILKLAPCKMRLTFGDGTTATVTAGKAIDLLYEGRDIVSAVPYGECGYLADLIVGLGDDDEY